MRIANCAKDLRAAGFFRLCLGIIISLSLAMGGMALNIAPAEAAPIRLEPPTTSALTVTVTAGQTYTYQFGHTDTSFTNAPPAQWWFYWHWPIVLPNWMQFDHNTGVLTVCHPPTLVAHSHTGWVRVIEARPAFPWWRVSAPKLVTINITPGVAGTITIAATPIPAVWEDVPFSMALSATGCTGNYVWSATGLPAWLTLDPNLGTLTGTPPVGTCNMSYNVTVTCTDKLMCNNYCTSANSSFVLYVDCWANYLAMVTTYTTTACDFQVQIGPGLTEGQTPVIINGNLETTLAGNGSQSFTSIPCESQLVVVEQTISGQDPDTKFECIGQNSKWVTDTDNVAYFDYAKKVYIKTDSDTSGVPPPFGSGWYAVNSDFSTTTPATVVSQSNAGTKFVFDSYSLPDGSTFPYSDLVYTVNKKGTVIARYKPYYLLQLKSDYPLVDESSWWPGGGKATWDLALQAVPGRNFFGAFGGTLEPVNSTGTRTMNAPYTQKIEWGRNWFWPIFWIVVTLLVIAAAVFYWLRRRRGAGGTAGQKGAPAKPPADDTTTVKTVKVDTSKIKSLPEAAHKKTGKVVTAVSTKPPARKALPKTNPKAEPKEKPGFCSKCGSPVSKGAVFCNKCGKKL